MHLELISSGVQILAMCVAYVFLSKQKNCTYAKGYSTSSEPSIACLLEKIIVYYYETSFIHLIVLIMFIHIDERI